MSLQVPVLASRGSGAGHTHTGRERQGEEKEDKEEYGQIKGKDLKNEEEGRNTDRGRDPRRQAPRGERQGTRVQEPPTKHFLHSAGTWLNGGSEAASDFSQGPCQCWGWASAQVLWSQSPHSLPSPKRSPAETEDLRQTQTKGLLEDCLRRKGG